MSEDESVSNNNDIDLYDLFKDRSTADTSIVLPAWTVKVHVAITESHSFVFFDKTSRIELKGKV